MPRLALPVAALVVALVAGCAAGDDGERVQRAVAVEDCPQAVPEGDGPQVPADPTAETGRRLLPEGVDPTGALVCRYGPQGDFRPPSAPPAGALVGRRQLTGGLEQLADDLFLPRRLAGQGRVCTLIGAARTPYLLRLTYPDGVVWLATAQDANSCVDLTNGTFTTHEYVGDRFAAAYETGEWRPRPVLPQNGPCRERRPGRAGQEGSLVPGEPVSLRVCSGGTGRDVGLDVLAAVRDVLAQPSAQPSDGTCSGAGAPSYELLFRYDAGPPVLVRFTVGCEPDVDNGSLQAQLAPADAERLQDLLAERQAGWSDDTA